MKKLLIVLVPVSFYSAISTFAWWQNGLQPVNHCDKTPQMFVVGNGEGVREIANNLKTDGLIRDPIVFFF